MNPYYASKFWPASLTLAEEEGLGWCRVGKVGTTAWSALFLLLRSVPLPDIQAAVANLTAHDLLKQLYPRYPHSSTTNLRFLLFFLSYLRPTKENLFLVAQQFCLKILRNSSTDPYLLYRTRTCYRS